MNLTDLIPKMLDRPEPQVVFDVSKLGFKSVMVTGAGGSIGTEVAIQLADLDVPTLILFELSELALYNVEQAIRSMGYTGKLVPVLGDVCNPRVLESVFRSFAVDTVIHAAAYKHVPLVERNPLGGVRNNFLGTDTLAECAVRCKVKSFLMVSTDKAVNPTNVMGASKRLAEWACLSRNGDGTVFRCVRFGNVMGSSGSVLPLFHRQLTTTRKVTVTHPDVSRFFMSVQEAVALVLQSMALPEGIYVFDMGKPVKIAPMVERMADLMGVKDYTIQFVGLRPGEKLYEELTLEEKLHLTSHPQIMQANEEVQCVKNTVFRAVQLIASGDTGGMRNLLQKMVPGYDPMCGIVDDVWLEINVLKALIKADDCFADTEAALLT